MGLDITISHGKRSRYFRKCNWLYGWVRRKLELPELENCKHYKLTRSIIEDLIDDITKVLSDHSLAEKLLPTESGFFFGSTEYDDWYFDDLRDAKTDLTQLLVKMSDGDTADFWSWY